MKFFCTLFVALSVYSFCYADTEETQKASTPHIGVGVGGTLNLSPYRGLGHKFTPLPVFTIRYDELLLIGPRLQYRFLGDRKRYLRALLNFNIFDPVLDPSEASYLSGMDERKGTIKFGIEGKYRIHLFKLVASIQHDAIARYKGSDAKLGIGFDFPFSVLVEKFNPIDDLTIPLSLAGIEYGIKYYDNHFTQYYYGVRLHESLPGREYFVPTEAINSYFQFKLRLHVTKNWTLAGIVEREFYSGDIKDSPLVNKGTIHKVFFGLIRQI